MRSTMTAYGITALGASFWGLTGLFVQNLYAFGLSPLHVVTIRMTLSAFIMFCLIGVIRPYLLKIYIRDIPHFIGLGVVSIALFNWCYFTVMERSTLSIAVVLLYTSPIFVAVISRFVFREPITKNKTAATILTLIGCSLVAGLLPNGEMNITFSILFIGVAAGFFCALYSIIGKFVSQKYHSVTITAYSMLCGAVFLFPISGITHHLEPFKTEPMAWVNALLSVFVSTISAYILYTAGLKYIESSHAAILSTMELVVAVAVGVVVFGDMLSIWQNIGITLVFSAILLAVFSRKQKFVKRQKQM
ncbi:Threonine/homoserine efflux transporter RhtA [Alteribacillus persepolensis]|uniref:Threonine/homoserine efflux transporter RhtA n=1 Tax=Alteribacillus persepolensis TaxID=568899 RepID=A0A1G8FMY8_9BACI|nr:DMT family transporter [Alteribacillus persepolensis]SDH83431.1 Threonine/homoserine efflux transporter RhtA [Alteribacillus persepolensis]